MSEQVDYVEVAIQMGVVGQRGRDVYAAIKSGIRQVSLEHGSITLINSPGSIIENPPGHPLGSYQVQKNATLLPLNVEDVNADHSKRVGTKKRNVKEAGNSED